MKNWFKATVKYFVTDENGKSKRATEEYLMESTSFTQAEMTVYQQFESMEITAFEITKLEKIVFSEVIGDGAGSGWYKAKVVFTTIDEPSGNEKKITENILIDAESVDDACEGIYNVLDEGMDEYVIKNISLTNIIEVWVYEQTVPENPSLN